MIIIILSVMLFIMLVVAIAINHKHIKKNKECIEERGFLRSVLERTDNPLVIFSEDQEVIFTSESAKKQFKDLVTVPKRVLSYDPQTNRLASPYNNIVITKSETSFKKERFIIFTLSRSELIENTPKEIETPKVNKKETQNFENTKITSIDPLSGLPNEFEAITKLSEIIQSRSDTHAPFGVLVLGIDHYQDINITLGHIQTNKLIKEISDFLKEHAEHLLPYRLDCDKFLLIAPKYFNDTAELNLFVREFLTLISSRSVSIHDIYLSASLGISKYPSDGFVASKLLDNATTALRKAQRHKESNFEVYLECDETISHQNAMQINDEITVGLRNREFTLYCQPIFELSSQKIVGAEVLLRWNHPKHGLISPDRFLQISEKTGLIVDLGEFVFEEATRQKGIWNDMGLKHLTMTINVSLREMRIEGLILKLERYISQNNLRPNEFILDITEDAAMLHHNKTVRDIVLFHDSGISLTLDGFGSGFFSISYLQKLPFDTLKLDRELTADIENNQEHRQTVKSIIALADSLGISIGVEGVENENSATIFKHMGCKYAQGYYFAKPVNLKDFIQFYNSYSGNL